MVGSTYWSLRGQLWYGIALAHGWWSYDTFKCRGVWLEVPTGAGQGRCEVRVRLRTTGEAMTRLSVEEYVRK